MRRPVRQEAGRFNPRRIVCELPLNGLKRGNRLAELPALHGVVASAFKSALGQTDRERRDSDSSCVEDLQRVDVTLAGFTHERVERYAAILEDNFARIAGTHAELVFLAPRTHAGRPAFHDEGGNAFGAARAIGYGHDE